MFGLVLLSALAIVLAPMLGAALLAWRAVSR